MGLLGRWLCAGETKGGRRCEPSFLRHLIAAQASSENMLCLAGFESRRMGRKKPATGRAMGFQARWRPQQDVRVRLRRPLPLRRFAPCVLRWKTLRVSSAPHPAGFESRRRGRKKPVTGKVTGFSNSMVPPTGFEPVISTLKGWRPWPLDDGDSAVEYTRYLVCEKAIFHVNSQC